MRISRVSRMALAVAALGIAGAASAGPHRPGEASGAVHGTAAKPAGGAAQPGRAVGRKQREQDREAREFALGNSGGRG